MFKTIYLWKIYYKFLLQDPCCYICSI